MSDAIVDRHIVATMPSSMIGRGANPDRRNRERRDQSMHLGYRPAILLACAMGLALVPAEPVGAADRSHRIVFKKTTPNDDIWPAIRKAYYGDDGVRVIAKVRETTVSRIERMIRKKLTWIAWFDLDEDGKDELFVVISQS